MDDRCGFGTSTATPDKIIARAFDVVSRLAGGDGSDSDGVGLIQILEGRGGSSSGIDGLVDAEDEEHEEQGRGELEGSGAFTTEGKEEILAQQCGELVKEKGEFGQGRRGGGGERRVAGDFWGGEGRDSVHD